ncbi:hypothetical protein [[Eubacterium] cellulosolvens]
MHSRIKISKDHLVISKTPFISEKYISLKNIESVEIYGKSVIPPLVFSIFLLAAQLILFSLGKMNTAIKGISIMFIINIPIIICLIIAILRSKFSTMKITSSDYDKSLMLHFVSRSKAESMTKEAYKIMNKK